MQDAELTFDGPVAVLTLSRPQARNAVRAETLDALEHAMATLRLRPAIGAVVIRAEGPAFCAGIDLEDAQRLAAAPVAQRRAFLERLQGLTRRLRDLPQATIAALDGPAVGLGAEIAVACDLRVQGDAASFRFPELSIGLFPTNGVTVLLAHLVGAGRAREMLLTGTVTGAADACTAGLGRRSDGPASAAATTLAHDLCATAPAALRQAVQALRLADDEALAGALNRETAAALALSEPATRPERGST